tara:strand:+ start:28 stop:435 length:408 start_codon:yes stop_codon:yes gene_type:complete
MLLQNKKRRFQIPPFISFFYTKENKGVKFKKLNQYEYFGLISILEEAFPFIQKRTCGTSLNNLINILNTITQNSPDDDYCMLGAFGLSKNDEIILEFWDYKTESKSKTYWISFNDVRNYNSMELKPFNCYLNNLN